MAKRLSLARIEEAASVIDPLFRNSPQLTFDTLSREVGAELVLKVETLNPIRSFKGRGALYYVHGMQDTTPLVAASAGNFGQALAYAARAHRLTLTMFAAHNANPLKIERIRELGAELILTGDDFDAAKLAARDYAARNGLRFVEDGREPAITEGAGTMAVELLTWPRPFDAVLVPLGNGAMINGMATWIKAHAINTRVVAVCAQGAPAMERSWRAGKMVSTPSVDTIADGIAVRNPVPEALDDMKGIVDEILLVDDAHILQAMRLLLHHTGLLVEPAGAAGVAALLTNTDSFQSQCVATPLCGGNVTADQFRHWFVDASEPMP